LWPRPSRTKTRVEELFRKRARTNREDVQAEGKKNPQPASVWPRGRGWGISSPCRTGKHHVHPNAKAKGTKKGKEKAKGGGDLWKKITNPERIDLLPRTQPIQRTSYDRMARLVRGRSSHRPREEKGARQATISRSAVYHTQEKGFRRTADDKMWKGCRGHSRGTSSGTTAVVVGFDFAFCRKSPRQSQLTKIILRQRKEKRASANDA